MRVNPSILMTKPTGTISPRNRPRASRSDIAVRPRERRARGKTRDTSFTERHPALPMDHRVVAADPGNDPPTAGNSIHSTMVVGD